MLIILYLNMSKNVIQLTMYNAQLLIKKCEYYRNRTYFNHYILFLMIFIVIPLSKLNYYFIQYVFKELFF